MYPIAHVTCDIARGYESDYWLTRIKERFSISKRGESYIKDLNLKISRISLPPNYNQKNYINNMSLAAKKVSRSNVYMAPETWRLYDYNNIYNTFQKKMFAHSVIDSIKLLLRVSNKSLKSSCIAIYDACDNVNKAIIEEAAKNCRFIILISNFMDKLNKLCNYIISEYGISPVITNDIKYAFQKANFIITSRKVQIKSEAFTWYVDNSFQPDVSQGKAVSEVTYSVPWQGDYSVMSPQLLGAILCQMGSRSNIEDILKQNDIYIDSILFNGKVINL
ncbi:hypothetical protein [Clostridium thermarum]|uniref:hypothetical protein n=1 Tax=Clostridium thermarum TaxID=1716543 RepID=UPI0013D79548|nr:hypothetical protein [Clostridium thermarum]